MDAQGFSIGALLESAKDAPDGWIQFMKADDLRAGVYRLDAGADDLQEPHEEDEIYYALAGKADLVVQTPWGEKVLPVQEGSVLYVPKKAKHRFRDIRERLELLVFFASPSRD